MSMYTGLSGINAATTDINVVSNNIANINTDGFKNSRAEFGDLVGSGTDSAGLGAQTQAVNQLFQQGGPKETGNALDFMINGNGFFVVKDASGTYYTRNGSFHIDAATGNIVNNLGQTLQGVGGADLKLGGTGPWTNITMDRTGAIFAVDSTGTSVTTTPAQVGLVDFKNVQGLQQISNTQWMETAESGPPTTIAAPGTGTLGDVRNGALETSNVDLTAQLVNMIIAQRNFQANAQTITTNNTMAQTIINIR